MNEKFHRICGKETVSRSSYNFALYYCLSRIIFSNGARCEYGYKAKRFQIRKTTKNGIKYHFIKLPDAKCAETMAVMNPDDYTCLKNYLKLSQRLGPASKPEESDMLFLNYDRHILDSHISEPLKKIMVHTVTLNFCSSMKMFVRFETSLLLLACWT